MLPRSLCLPLHLTQMSLNVAEGGVLPGRTPLFGCRDSVSHTTASARRRQAKAGLSSHLGAASAHHLVSSQHGPSVAR